jgi:hypothetical protein
MSGRLVGEVADWLCTPAADGLTSADAAVLLAIAERANEKDREMWRHRGDDGKLIDRICAVARLSPGGASNVFKKLARRGLEVRIPLGHGKDGRPIFAYEGKAMRFRLPELPASVALPERAVTQPPSNPVDNSPETPAKPARGQSHNRPLSPEPSCTTALSAPEGGCTTAPSTSKELPSNKLPSTPVDPSSVVTVEDAGPDAATPPADPSHHMGWNPDYREARDYLFALTNEGQEFMAAAAEHLGANAPIADRVIYAARLASEGIPA